jgi:hypothetical protein
MSQIVVHFRSKRGTGGRTLVAVSQTTGSLAVKGVISKRAKSAFLRKKLVSKAINMPPGEVPAQIKLRAVVGDGTEPTKLKSGERGPEDVCYWVGDVLICWE